MVDAANPADPSRRSPTTADRRGTSSRRNRWLATDTPAAAPAAHVAATGSGSPGGRPRGGPSPLSDRRAALCGWMRPGAFGSRGIPHPALELELNRRSREPSPLLLAPARLVGVRGQRGETAAPVGPVGCAHDPARVRARSDGPRPSTRGRRRAAVRDLALPGLVLARGAGLCTPDPRRDIGDAGGRLPPSPPGSIGSLRASGWALLAYVFGTTAALLAHNTAVFLPIGANVLMLGWWWTHGRGPKGFLRNWLLAQVAVLCLWASWLPAYLHQVADGGAYSWIPRPTVGSVLSGAYAVYAGVTRATPYPLEAVVIVALAALGLWSWRHDRRWMAFVLVFALSAPLAELLVSLWRPIFLTQTLIWSAVPLNLAVAAGLLCLRPRVFVAALADPHRIRRLRSQELLLPSRQGGVGPGRGVRGPGGAAGRRDRLQRGLPPHPLRPLLHGAGCVLGARSGAHGEPRRRLRGARGDQDEPPRVADRQPPQDQHRRGDLSLGEAGRLVGVAQFTDVDVYLYENG